MLNSQTADALLKTRVTYSSSKPKTFKRSTKPQNRSDRNVGARVFLGRFAAYVRLRIRFVILLAFPRSPKIKRKRTNVDDTRRSVRMIVIIFVFFSPAVSVWTF